MTDSNGIEFYQTQSQEHIKQYIEFDGEGRSYKTYTASSNCPVGGPCEVTLYGYINLTATIINARKEERGIWVQAFEDAILAL